MVKRNVAFGLILMLAGRAMTIPFIGRAGGSGIGDPPKAWIMPLLGDAAVGVSALVVAYLVWKRPQPSSWLVAVVWSAIGAFDALAALVIEVSFPWPEFFMLDLFGRPMFFMAVAAHALIIYLLTRSEVRSGFGIRWARTA